MQILIVDDHLAWRNALRLFLSSLANIEVMADVADGMTALKLCQVVQPDVILMDIHMPGMDGYQTAQAILALQPHVGMVGISSDSTDECREKALVSGFYCLLTKGSVMEELPGVLAELERKIASDYTNANPCVDPLTTKYLKTEMAVS
jgi:DNA-binding NarL/FixJ family response regulator